jgi:hypothetical protein
MKSTSLADVDSSQLPAKTALIRVSATFINPLTAKICHFVLFNDAANYCD